ncbi:zinc-dependent metalloprotease [Rhodococcus sp. HNM0569]|uniref:zinc-dependent metalloprotease n=1 Tax=Rhodococcus sp. HNM0569 TaxID=2716340 RepID=UPI00146DCAF8|nr:zinc-dependent metalloprotease [Rhodococcus sp. HNM0569]NLU82080.1 zinc-dependent metalloprotease [Rhodococcus sp. HNM0569]
MTSRGDDATGTENAESGLFSGSVDWNLAARTGARLARPGPAMSRYTHDAVTAELVAAAVRAESPVREVTGLADGLPIPAARVLDRPGWISAATSSMAELTGSDDAARGLVVGKPAGLQVGVMLAYLSSAILGQYDPFTDDGTLLLVAPNVVAVERALRVQPHDFRMWVCLHEVTHRVQFSSSPWLADHMKSAVDTLGGGDDEPLTDMIARLSAAVRARRENAPRTGPGGLVGLLRESQAPAQRDALDRLLVLGTLLEGHADHVMDAVGPAVVPTVGTIRAAFDRRRRRPANPVQRLIRALLGMDAKMAQYVRGKAFVDAVVAKVGMERFNVVWTDASTLPRYDEIDDPDAWIARVLG